MEIKDIIEKARHKDVDVKLIESQWDPKKHAIFTDFNKYPDRKVRTEFTDPNTGKKHSKEEIVDLIRIGLPYQKMITKTAATFFCGIPIKYTNEGDELIYESLLNLITKQKLKHFDRDVYKALSKWTECAELWYTKEHENEYYGFNSKFKLDVILLTPDENKLYPEFDDKGSMVRFSREFEMDNGVTYFESYTDGHIEKYKREKSEWVEVDGYPKENPLGKIPVSYYTQDHTEWYDVQEMIERLEEIYSNIGESNDRFAFPILKLTGELVGSISRDRSGKVMELTGENPSAEFVVPPDAAKNLTMEIKRLERDVHDLTNTPNINPSNLQGLGNMISGIAMKYFFMSAHLKVMDKEPIYEKGIQRRISVIEGYFKLMNSKFRSQKLDVEPVITPYIIDNEEDLARYLMDISDGQPLVSQKHAMELFGIEDPEKMIENIQEETNNRADQNNAHEFFGM